MRRQPSKRSSSPRCQTSATPSWPRAASNTGPRGATRSRIAVTPATRCSSARVIDRSASMARYQALSCGATGRLRGRPGRRFVGAAPPWYGGEIEGLYCHRGLRCDRRHGRALVTGGREAPDGGIQHAVSCSWARSFARDPHRCDLDTGHRTRNGPCRWLADRGSCDGRGGPHRPASRRCLLSRASASAL